MVTAIEPNTHQLIQMLLNEIQALRAEVTTLRSSSTPAMFEFPARLPKALLVAEKFTSTLPAVSLAVVRDFAETMRGNAPMNVVLHDALRAHIPQEHWARMIKRMMDAERALWTTEATKEDVERGASRILA